MDFVDCDVLACLLFLMSYFVRGCLQEGKLYMYKKWGVGKSLKSTYFVGNINLFQKIKVYLNK